MNKVPTKRAFNYLNPYQNLANIQPVPLQKQNDNILTDSREFQQPQT